MADNKQKPNENPQGQPQGVPDVLKLGDVKQSPKAPQIAAEKTDVKKDTTKGAAEMKREILQMEVNPDKDTPAKIDRLDATQGLESKEQKEGFELLQTVTVTTLLAVLFDNGIKKEALQTIESMGGIGGDMLAKLNPAERVSLKKLQEIGAKPGSELYSALKERWNRMVSRGHEIYTGAKKAKESLSSPAKGVAGAPTTAHEEPKTFWGKIGDFAKEHPILTAGIAIGGAYGAYKIFKWFTSSDEEEEKEEGKKGFLGGIMDKILGGKWASRLKWGLGISAGIFVLGRLIGNEDIGKWLKDKLGINITGNRLSQFLIHLSHGEFVEAFKELLAGPDENFDVHRRMAEKITKETGTTVTPETLKGIGGIKFDDYMSMIAEGKSAVAGVLGQIPGISLLVGSAQSAEEEKTVRKYFENHKEQIDHFKNTTTTVDQVLINLDGEEKLPPPSPEVQAIAAAIDQLPPENKAMGEELKLDMQRLIPDSDIAKVVAEAKKIPINTEKIEKIWAERKQAYQELLEATKNKDVNAIPGKAEKLFEINNKLGEARNSLVEEIMKRRGWTEAQLLAATHLPKAIGWAFLPQWKKEYGKYMIGKYLKAPVKAVKEVIGLAKGIPSSELIGREFKPSANTAEIAEDIKKNKADVDQADKSLKEAENQPKTKPADEITREIEHNKSKLNLLNKDTEIHNVRKTIAEAEAQVLQLRTNGGSAADIVKAEKIIEENKSMMRTLVHERLELQGKFLTYEIAERRAVFSKRFGTEGEKGVLTRTYIEQMDALESSISTHRKQLDLQIADRMTEAEKLAKEGKDIKAVAKEINELTRQKIRLDVGNIDTYQSLAKKWTTGWDLNRALKGGGAATPEIEQMMRQEKNEMQKLWYKILNGQSSKEGVVKSVTNITKGKLTLYGGFMALGTYINFRDKRESEAWSKALTDSALQAAVDTIPFTSTYSDFYSAIKGEEIITGRKLDATDRGLRFAFGVGSGLCDASVLAGTFMRLRAARTIMKEASAVGKSMELGEALKAAKGDINEIEALREMSKTGHWVNKLALGGALGTLGYCMIFQPVTTIDISPETKAILGDQMQDHDIEPPKIDTPAV